MVTYTGLPLLGLPFIPTHPPSLCVLVCDYLGHNKLGDFSNTKCKIATLLIPPHFHYNFQLPQVLLFPPLFFVTLSMGTARNPVTLAHILSFLLIAFSYAFRAQVPATLQKPAAS